MILSSISINKATKNNPEVDIFILTNGIHTDAIYGESDSFYKGIGHYSLIKTCNTWANNALKSCDQKACLWIAFSSGIFKLYK